MAGLGSLVVGYRPGDRRVQKLKDDFGLEAIPVRNCIAGCGYPVYFYSGGVDAVREKDAEVICQECRERYYDEIVMKDL